MKNNTPTDKWEMQCPNCGNTVKSDNTEKWQPNEGLCQQCKQVTKTQSK